MNLHCLRTFLCAAALAALLPGAKAALLTYDGFDYPSGDNINGKSGGSGWNGAWNLDGGGGSQTVASSSPLSYSPLVTSGNYITGSGYRKAGRKLDNTAGGVWDTNGNISDIWTLGQIDQGTVWASFLVSRNKNVESWEGFSVYVHQDFTGNAGTPSNSPFHISIDHLTQNWQVQNMGGAQTSLGSTAIGESVLFVLKMELDPAGTGNNLYLWMNPSASTLGGADLAVGTANWSATGLSTASARFRSFAVQLGGSTGSYDEIRFGTDYASVTPIPEPGVFALAALGLGAVILRRRRAA